MDRWFNRFSRRVEGYVFYFTILFIVLLVVIQALMISSDVRQYLSRVDMLEGEPYTYTIIDEDDHDAQGVSGSEQNPSSMELTLEVLPPQTRLKIMVNGEEKAILYDEPLVISVAAGDLVEVEGEEADGDPAKVRVVGSVGLKHPQVGDEITVFGDNELIGWVIPDDLTPTEE